MRRALHPEGEWSDEVWGGNERAQPVPGAPRATRNTAPLYCAELAALQAVADSLAGVTDQADGEDMVSCMYRLQQVSGRLPGQTVSTAPAYDQAVAGPEQQQYQQAMAKEMENMEGTGPSDE